MGLYTSMAQATRTIRALRLVLRDRGEEDLEQFLSHVQGLRGLSVKLLQLLHELDDVVPADGRRLLQASFEEVPPMAPRQVHDVLQRELGRHWMTAYAHFDDEPMAAASIGQVHRATLPDGRDVVVKVQYPSLATHLTADLHTMRSGAGWTSLGRQHMKVIDELHARFAEELDYGLEARRMAWFHPRLAEVGIDVPLAVPDLSTNRVLTMTRVAGSAPTAMAQPHRRQQVTGALWTAWRRTVVDWGMLHGDLSRGNIRITAEGQVGWLDFGSVRPIDGPARALLSGLLTRPQDVGTGAMRGLFEEMGVLASDTSSSDYATWVAPVEHWFAGPAESWRGWAAAGRRSLRGLLRSGVVRQVDPAFVMMFRSFHGLSGVLETLEPRQEVAP